MRRTNFGIVLAELGDRFAKLQRHRLGDENLLARWRGRLALLCFGQFSNVRVFTGERRFEPAVQEATLLHQTNGPAKPPAERKHAEIRGLPLGKLRQRFRSVLERERPEARVR